MRKLSLGKVPCILPSHKHLLYPNEITNIEACKNAIKNECSNISDLKTQTSLLREKHLQTRACYYAKLKHQSETSIINNIKQSEKIINLYKKLKLIPTGSKHKSINYIIDTEGKIVHEKTEVERIILNHSSHVFASGKDTFVMGRYTPHTGYFHTLPRAYTLKTTHHIHIIL